MNTLVTYDFMIILNEVAKLANLSLAMQRSLGGFPHERLHQDYSEL
ncbi:hypothetical protein [Moorena bouillonii]|nr:hypothetical protein [Moorena bouillonii]